VENFPAGKQLCGQNYLRPLLLKLSGNVGGRMTVQTALLKREIPTVAELRARRA
jgi:hypothetical protein